jgi:hypothetical protein
MSKIKDLYAEVEGIDDLKPTYNREFFDKVQKADEERAVEYIFKKGKEWDGARRYFMEHADFEYGINDEGLKELYFENFTELCDKAAMELTDGFIEDEHFDMDDNQYDRITNKVGDLLADYYADLESELIHDELEDRAGAQMQRESYNNLTLPKD